MALIPLAGLDDLAAYVQDDVDPVQGAFYLRLASSTVRGFLRSSVTLTLNDTVTLSPMGVYVFFPDGPVQSVSAVSVQDDWTSQWSDVTASVDVDLYNELIVPQPYSGLTWPGRPASWQVTYNHGYTEVPDAIMDVTVQLAGDMYATPAGVAREGIGGYSVMYDKDGPVLSDSQRATISDYRRMSIA